MTQCLRDACLFYYVKNGTLSGLLLFHVDDVLSSGNDTFNEDIIRALRQKYNFRTVNDKDFIFTGLHISQNEDFEIFLDQDEYINQMELFHYPNENPDKLLSRDATRCLRKSTGQLLWASSQTRPDLAFDALSLSTILNRATYRNAKRSRKIVSTAKENSLRIKFSHLGNLKDLHIEIYADASLGNLEDNLETKSVMGSLICLANDSLKINPLHWKAKMIEKVTPDIKTAETLSLENAIDDAVHLSQMITEIYSENNSNFHLPLIINEDSKALVDSLHSTKKVKRKTMRVVISCIQQYMKTGTIKEINHVRSNEQLADVFTKHGVPKFSIMNTLSKGKIEKKSSGVKESIGENEDANFPGVK